MATNASNACSLSTQVRLQTVIIEFGCELVVALRFEIVQLVRVRRRREHLRQVLLLRVNLELV